MADNGISNSYKPLQKLTELFEETKENAMEIPTDSDSDSLFPTNNEDTSTDTDTSQITLRDIVCTGDEIPPDFSDQPWDEKPDDLLNKEPDPNMPDNAWDL